MKYGLNTTVSETAFLLELSVTSPNIEGGLKATVKRNFKLFYMLIGELIKRSGMTKDAIRFYERKGLITVDRKQRRSNNYKEYSEEILNRLLLIRAIKDFGFTINEIDELFALWQREDNVCDLEDPFHAKLQQIDNQIKRLTELRGKLVSSMNKCKVGNCEFEKLTFSYLDRKN